MQFNMSAPEQVRTVCRRDKYLANARNRTSHCGQNIVTVLTELSLLNLLKTNVKLKYVFVVRRRQSGFLEPF